MKNTLFFLISAFIFINTLSGQTNQDALQILDKFAAKASKAPSIFMKFDLIMNNEAEKTTDTLKGSVILNKDKYRLELPNNIVWFNGTTSWSYLQAEQEVTITKADKKDNSFQNKPSLIFTIYKKDYKNRLIEETNESYVIDLYPIDIKTDILRIRLTIGKKLLDLKSLEYKRRDGITSTLKVKDYDLTRSTDALTFEFQKSAYKDAEIIDMR